MAARNLTFDFMSEQRPFRLRKRKPLQKPGELWTFPCGHSGTLPNRIRESNSFGQWQMNLDAANARGGCWCCRACRRVSTSKTRRGLGPKAGVLGRMRSLISRGKEMALKRKHAAPVITPEELLALWTGQDERCAACNRPIVLVGARDIAARLDHDHITGAVRGFLCDVCNIVEGFLKGII